MGTTCNRPKKRYRRSFWVTQHAIEKLRSRLKGEDLACRSDRYLGNLIDSSVLQAIDEDEYEDIKDQGDDARLVDLRDYLEGSLWALIKKNSYNRAFKDYPKAVVTLLEDWHVKRSKKSGKWEFEDPNPYVRVGGLKDEAKAALLEFRSKLAPSDGGQRDRHQSEKTYNNHKQTG